MKEATQQYSIGIIGLGNMGSAFFKSLEKSHNVIGFDVDAEKMTAHNSSATIEKAIQTDFCILAIKPQTFSDFAQKVAIPDTTTVISIMAGISLETLQKELNTNKIVRSMPNLAITQKKGVIGWASSEVISEEENKTIQSIFEELGVAIRLENENQLDAITALSGSGPAYFFYVTELLQAKAEQYGFPQAQAKEVANQTIIGTAHMLENNTKEAKEWKEAVTSKGGTTQAALEYLAENNLDQLFSEAIDAAKKRSEELNQ